MPSSALTSWKTKETEALDRFVVARRNPGRRRDRRIDEELNHAYAVMLAAHFQHFCRNLHSEAAQHLASAASPTALSDVLHALLVKGRQLDQGNARASSLGDDFGRFGFKFWPAVHAKHPRNGARQRLLDALIDWRNAIAHQNFSGSKPLVPLPPLRFSHVDRWRSACNALAQSMDSVVRDRIHAVVGHRPW
jgi:RiboL-PSP-HEPN